MSRVKLPTWRWLLAACVISYVASVAAREALEAIYPGSRWAVVLGMLIGPLIGLVVGTAAGHQVAAKRNPHPYSPADESTS